MSSGKANGNIDEVIGKVVSELVSAGVRVSFKTPRSRKDKNKQNSCEGSYLSGDKVLTVTTSNPNWKQTLLHEYQHFKQEELDLWTTEEECLLWPVWDSWVKKKANYPKNKVLKACRTIQACELDCEKRTVKFMKDNHLPFDVDRYTRIANVYILSYEASRLLRNNFDSLHPVEVPEIFNMMPARFLRDYTKLPKGMLDLIKAHCL